MRNIKLQNNNNIDLIKTNKAYSNERTRLICLKVTGYLFQ